MSERPTRQDYVTRLEWARQALDAQQRAMDDAILAAREFIVKSWYQHLTMDDVAKHAGVSRATAFRWAERAADAAAEYGNETATPASASQSETAEISR